MFRKVVAWLILVCAILVVAGVAYRFETFIWKVPLAVAASLAGIAGAIGLLRSWPHAHHLAGLFPLVIAGLSVWNAVEMNMLVGRRHERQIGARVQSAFRLAWRTTLPHFSVSAARNVPQSAGVPTKG
jgi:hypothetical protein